MITYNISINKELAVIVEEMMQKGKYANRSEFFRDVIRHLYLGKDDYFIEELDKTDPDYKYIDSRKKDADYITLEEFKDELNV